MSENPGPATPGTPPQDDDQRTPPVDTGPGPRAADVDEEPADTTGSA